MYQMEQSADHLPVSGHMGEIIVSKSIFRGRQSLICLCVFPRGADRGNDALSQLGHYCGQEDL